MTQEKTDRALRQLLDMASDVPSSPQLRREIIVHALLNDALDETSPAPASPQLGKDILAKANAQTSDDNVIAFRPNPARPVLPRWISGNLVAGGVIAASLMIGIWTGSNGIADDLINAPLEFAGLQAPDENTDLNFYEIIGGPSATENLL